MGNTDVELNQSTTGYAAKAKLTFPIEKISKTERQNTLGYKISSDMGFREFLRRFKCTNTWETAKQMWLSECSNHYLRVFQQLFRDFLCHKDRFELVKIATKLQASTRSDKFISGVLVRDATTVKTWTA